MEQACRDEHYTRENRGIRMLRLQYHMHSICARFPYYLRAAQRRRRRKQRRIKREAQAEVIKQRIKMRHKVLAWIQQCKTLKKNIVALHKQYAADPLSVTGVDWDRLVKGSQGKIQYLYGKKCPREKWPAGVPYLNLLALRQLRDREKMKIA